MKKVYVAHPYGGKEENKLSVETLVRKMVKHNPNILYFSPIHSTGYLYNDVGYKLGMEYCFELLKVCDELLLCEGWENNVGCNMEKKFAEENNIPINYMHTYISSLTELTNKELQILVDSICGGASKLIENDEDNDG